MHPINVRERAVAAYESGKGSYQEIADIFGVGIASLVRWRKRFVEDGTVAPVPRGGGNPARVRQEDEKLVRKIVGAHNDWLVEEIAVAFVEETGRACSASSMSRALRKLGLTRKKSR